MPKARYGKASLFLALQRALSILDVLQASPPPGVRELPDAEKQRSDGAKAIASMLAEPSMIKRPVLDLGGGKLLVGFKPEAYTAAIAARN